MRKAGIVLLLAILMTMIVFYPQPAKLPPSPLNKIDGPTLTVIEQGYEATVLILLKKKANEHYANILRGMGFKIDTVNPIFPVLIATGNKKAIVSAARLPWVERIESLSGLGAPAWDNLQQIKAKDVWQKVTRDGNNVTGKGVVIGLIDAGLDWRNPLFWRADGEIKYPYKSGLYWYVDGHRIRIIDLDSDGLFNASIDYLYEDIDNNGVLDFPNSSYHEPMYVLNDSNGNYQIDAGEAIVELKTCKLGAIFDLVQKQWRFFGQPDFDSRIENFNSTGPSTHATSLAAILIGGQPGFNRAIMGVAPDATLYFFNVSILNDTTYNSSVHTSANIVATAEEYMVMRDVYYNLYEGFSKPPSLDIDVVVLGFNQYKGLFLNGHDALDVMLDSLDIPVVVPAGNLADSRKHLRMTIPSGINSTAIMKVPESIVTGVQHHAIYGSTDGNSIHDIALYSAYDTWDDVNAPQEIPGYRDPTEFVNITIIINTSADVQLTISKESGTSSIGNNPGDDCVNVTPTTDWTMVSLGAWSFPGSPPIIDLHYIYIRKTVDHEITRIEVGIERPYPNKSDDTVSFHPEWMGEYIQVGHWWISIKNNGPSPIEAHLWIYEFVKGTLHGPAPGDVEIVWEGIPSGPVKGTVLSPGLGSDVITVGATNSSGGICSFSGRGPITGAQKPDVVAPGENILSVVPGHLVSVSGTTFAAAHVAGVIALIQQVWKEQRGIRADKNIIKAIIRENASGTGFNDAEGWGIVDALQSVDVRPPSMSMYGPANGTHVHAVNYTFAISLNAIDQPGDIGIYRIEVYDSDTLVTYLDHPPAGTNTTIYVTREIIGWRKFIIRAVDMFGNVNETTIWVHIEDATLPQIKVYAYNNTEIMGIWRVEFDAQDNYQLKQIVVRLNGTTIYSKNVTDASGKFSVEIVTQNYPNGIYLLEIEAIDSYGNVNTTVLIINIQNPEIDISVLINIGIILGMVAIAVVAILYVRKIMKKRAEEKEILPSRKEVSVNVTRTEMLSEDMTICWKCGMPIKKSARKCPYCGAEQ